MNQNPSPHVGVRYESHGGARPPMDQQWWWRNYPWWGYQQGWPWYGMQEQCYLDPYTGAWVCPESPWVYRPQIMTWYNVGRPWRRRAGVFLS